jgi:flagellar hook-basal body complex protein FliE
MIAIQKADISMRLLLTVRNKVIEAYKEIMHMQF